MRMTAQWCLESGHYISLNVWWRRKY